MLYLFSPTTNSYGLVDYDHENSIEYNLFFEFSKLNNLAGIEPILFNISKKSSIPKILKLNLIESTGPIIVSQSLRNIIEQIAPTEVEFFNACIKYEDQVIDGFSCIHPLLCVDCIDMEISEYERTNFDHRNPTYSFLYYCVSTHPDFVPHIASCAEYKRQLVVNEVIKNACIEAKLRGLGFYKSIDLTPNNRTRGIET